MGFRSDEGEAQGWRCLAGAGGAGWCPHAPSLSQPGAASGIPAVPGKGVSGGVGWCPHAPWLSRLGAVSGIPAVPGTGVSAAWDLGEPDCRRDVHPESPEEGVWLWVPALGELG